MKIKTSELIGDTLDWAVALIEYPEWKEQGYLEVFPYDLHFDDGEVYSPSTDWTQAGPIVEREKIEWQWLPSSHKAHQYGARKPSLGGLNRTFCMDGPTILIAAMRCYVASKLGDEVEIPEELTESKS